MTRRDHWGFDIPSHCSGVRLCEAALFATTSIFRAEGPSCTLGCDYALDAGNHRDKSVRILESGRRSPLFLGMTRRYVDRKWYSSRW
jgi:hypothetical protein